jgi:hypothetical protein
MTDTKPTIDEKIEAAKDAVNAYRRLKNHGRIAGDDAKLHKFGDVCSPQAILASLERLKKIDAVQVPDENDCVGFVRARAECGNKEDAMVAEYIDTLRDLLKRESADAKHYREKSDLLSDAAFQSEDRAEAAESKLAAIEKLGREPTKEMCKAGGSAISLNGGEGGDLEMESDAQEAFTAMFNKMMEELK